MKQDDFITSLKTIKKHLANQGKKKTVELIQDSLEQESYCNCKDTNSNPKTLYMSHKDAQKEIRYLLEAQQLSLNIYSCPIVRGWHLTKG